MTEQEALALPSIHRCQQKVNKKLMPHLFVKCLIKKFSLLDLELIGQGHRKYPIQYLKMRKILSLVDVNFMSPII